MTRGWTRRALAGALLTAVAATATTGTAEAQGFDPAWAANLPPQPTAHLGYDPTKTPVQNGRRLKFAILALQPGDWLAVGPGNDPGLGVDPVTGRPRTHYVLPAGFRIDGPGGTAAAPILIAGELGREKPVLTRAGQEDVVQVGSTGIETKYVAMRGFEVTGGGIGVVYRRCREIWFDRFLVHHTGGGGFKGPLNTPTGYAPERLYLTRNEIHDTQTLGLFSFGEGMRLELARSTIAANYVHDTLGAHQGDGIEIEAGSWGNWIVKNVVRTTRYPCFFFVGDDGSHPNEPTVIERNLAYDSLDNVFQYEDGANAILRNNVFVGPNGNKAFDSSHGAPSNVQIVHNTFVSSNGYTCGLLSWRDDLPGLVFANNVAYSSAYNSSTYAVRRLPTNTDGSPNTTGLFTGNVCVGNVQNVPASGYVLGNDVSDFRGVSHWSSILPPTSSKDLRLQLPAVQPSTGGAIVGTADATWLVPRDFMDVPRDTGTAKAEAGALELWHVP